MAFKNKGILDNSDIQMWAMDKSAYVFEDEIKEEKSRAMRELLKCKACDHDKHAEKYKAFDKILGLIEEARKLK